MKIRSQIGPFSIVPEWVMDRGLSATGLKLYVILGRFADYDTGIAFPSRETLAARMNCSEKTVDRAVAELERAECVEVWSPGRYLSNRYRVLQVDPRGTIDETFLSTDETDLSDDETNLSSRSDTDVHLTRTTKREPKNNNHLTRQSKITADDYKPTDEFLQKLATEYPGVRLEVELEKFRDHHMANGSSFKIWDRAFRKWIRQASDWSPEARAARVRAEEEAKFEQWKRENGE
jgi:hypothetical protein